MFECGMMDERGGGVAGLVAVTVGISMLVLGCDAQADPSYEGEPLMTVSGQVESALTVGEVEVGVLWLTTTGGEDCSEGEGCSQRLDLVCTSEVRTESEPSACVDACGSLSPTCQNLDTWEPCVDACPDVTYQVTNARSALRISGGVGQTTRAVGEFPAQFSLDILEPPPPEVLVGSATGERIAYGLFVAIDPAGEPWRLDLKEPIEYPDWLLGGSESHVLLYAPDGVPEGSIWAQTFGFTLAPGYQLLEPFVDQDDEEGDDDAGFRPVPPGDASRVRLTLADPATISWPLP
jgi:hypothetical protein